jgi:hypothetical protein
VFFFSFPLFLLFSLFFLLLLLQLKIPLEQIETISKGNSFLGMLPTQLEVTLKDGKKYLFCRMFSRDLAFADLQQYVALAKQRSGKEAQEEDDAAAKRLGIEYTHTHNKDFHDLFGHAEDLIDGAESPNRSNLIIPQTLAALTASRLVVCISLLRISLGTLTGGRL